MTTPAAITLPSLLETHDQPFVIIDAGLKIVAVNRVYERSFGIARETLLGRPCCAVTGEAAAAGDCRHRQMFRDLEPYRLLHRCVDPGGRELCWQIRGYPLVDADHAIYLGETLLPTQPAAAGSAVTRMIGRSPAFFRLIEQLDRAAASEVPVLLIGETGTGKELAADYIHKNSARRERDLVVVDCTVIGEDLFESELFGHEKGAFTGAAGSRDGLFQAADRGTLFLDELGELPLSQQPKLLRALESGTFRRVGGTQTRRADVRVIAATHRRLGELVGRGEFREDLYYRLAVFPVNIPPLRERQDDIPLLARHMLDRIGDCLGHPLELAPEALRRLIGYPYPGNVRELRNILQLAATLCFGGRRIEAEHIVLGHSSAAPPGRETAGGLNPLEHMEAIYLADLIRKHRGNRRAMAAEMNISERTLYRKLKRFNLKDAEP